MSDPDTRETLDPAWEKLARERAALIWDMHFAEYTGPDAREERAALLAWERDHAEKWNRLKPWYEVRIG